MIDIKKIFQNIEKVYNVAYEMQLLRDEFKKYNDILYPDWNDFNSGQHVNEINSVKKAHLFFSTYEDREKSLFKRCKKVYSEHLNEIEEFMKFDYENIEELKDFIKKWDILR